MSDNEFMKRFDQFPPEVLKAHDGEVVSLTDKPGGRVIGEATLKYNAEDEVLEAHFSVTDPAVAKALKGTMPSPIGAQSPIFKKES